MRKKVPTSNNAHNLPIFFHYCRPAQNQSKSQFLFHKITRGATYICKKDWRKNSGLFFDTCLFSFFRLAKLMKSLARWEITLSALICLTPLRQNLSKKTKHFTLTLPNSYLSKCFFLVETKNVSVQIYIFFKIVFQKCEKIVLRPIVTRSQGPATKASKARALPILGYS